MLLYNFQSIRKLLGGKWGKVTAYFFGHRWIRLDPEALEFDEAWQEGILLPKVFCCTCGWSGSSQRAANGIHEGDYHITCADGSSIKPGDPLKVCPVCGSNIYERNEP